jgi:hypothetical protein
LYFLGKADRELISRRACRLRSYFQEGVNEF